MALTGIRLKLQKLMKATIADEAHNHTWSYHAVRPLNVPPAWQPDQRVVADCSKGVQFLCEWAGAPDPMQAGFNPYGNSQTIWLRLHHLAAATELEVGDIVTFGVDGGEHAAMVLQAGADPLLWSFGHQGAPNSYRLSADRRVHQFCKLPIIEPPPTPVQKLQAMTGFYSWVAWKLGEGPWKRYDPATPLVRPNVPRIIRPTWWARYAAFLRNRTKGDAATTAA